VADSSFRQGYFTGKGMEEKTKLDQRIESLETKLQQDRALLAKLKARQSSKQRKQSHALDTRRKILAGAVVLKKAEGNTEFAAELNRWLHDGLLHDRDRALFPALPPKK
jgi:large subunit ribosomal protein L7/L12